MCILHERRIKKHTGRVQSMDIPINFEAPSGKLKKLNKLLKNGQLTGFPISILVVGGDTWCRRWGSKQWQVGGTVYISSCKHNNIYNTLAFLHLYQLCQLLYWYPHANHSPAIFYVPLTLKALASPLTQTKKPDYCLWKMHMFINNTYTDFMFWNMFCLQTCVNS